MRITDKVLVKSIFILGAGVLAVATGGESVIAEEGVEDVVSAEFRAGFVEAAAGGSDAAGAATWEGAEISVDGDASFEIVIEETDDVQALTDAAIQSADDAEARLAYKEVTLNVRYKIIDVIEKDTLGDVFVEMIKMTLIQDTLKTFEFGLGAYFPILAHFQAGVFTVFAFLGTSKAIKIAFGLD